MSPTFAAPGSDSGTSGYRQASIQTILIERCGLAGHEIQLIADVMRVTGIDFPTAGVRVGLISPEDVIWSRDRLGGSRDQHDPRPDAAFESDPGFVRRPISWRGRRDALVENQPVGATVRPVMGVAGLKDRFSPRSERILALRTELLLTQSHVQSQCCMIAVVSAFPGEGRSRLAAELAVSFAQLRDSTLLVDADMRRPTQHNLFQGADRAGGLAKAIAAGAQPAVQPVEGLPELSLLSAGILPQNPLDLLSDVRFEDLIASWKSHYRFVIFDTPPVSECADALAVARAAGRALVVCRADRTTYEGARAMLRRLAVTQAEVLGAVVNRF